MFLKRMANENSDVFLAIVTIILLFKRGIAAFGGAGAWTPQLTQSRAFPHNFSYIHFQFYLHGSPQVVFR